MGIALLAALVYFMLRKRRARSNNSGSLEYKHTELEAKSRSQELSGSGRPAEMGDGSRHELEGGWQGHEFQ